MSTFKTAIRDFDELYDVLNSEEEHEIGYFLLQESGPLLGSLMTRLSPRQANYALFSILSAPYHDLQEEIPNREIERRLKERHQDKYSFENTSKDQMVIKAVQRTYIISKKTMYLENLGIYNRLIFETKQKKETGRAFLRTLTEHNEILEALVPSLYAGSPDIPDVTYFLEMTLERTKKEYKTSSGSNGHPSEKNISLDSLEKLIEIEDPLISFEHIGGCKRGKEEMMMICEDIEQPEIARFFGRDPEQKKGILLCGDYGCGKTLLVKALATKLKKDLLGKVKFYVLHYKDITSIYRGGEAIATGQIFDLVEKNEKQGLKTILFIDELHVVAERRKDGLGPKDEALDTLLSHMDGMKKYKGLTIIGSTYQPLGSLDKALIRPGRFGTWIMIEKPTKEERTDIFGIYIDQRREWAAHHGNKKLFSDLDMEKLSEATEGFNGSDIAQIVEKTVRNRERAARKKAGHGEKEKILKGFKPVNTAFFLEMIADYKKKRGKKEALPASNSKGDNHIYFPFTHSQDKEKKEKLFYLSF